MTITPAKSVAHSNCMLGIRSHDADDEALFPANDIIDTDCYVSGKVHSHDGAIVFNECGDNVVICILLNFQLIMLPLNSDLYPYHYLKTLKTQVHDFFLSG